MSLSDIFNVVWILFLVQAFLPLLAKRMLVTRRQMAMRAFEVKRKSRFITMIHRQETMSILGFPVARYIDIEDSEQVLRVIRMTPPEMPIDMIMHTPGGLVLASEQIAWALKRHQGKVTVFIPHYAMSGGTLVAMAADEIVMDPNAVLGPVDPQLGGGARGDYYPAASVLKALEVPNPNRSDETLILGDVARKAIDQVYNTVYGLLLEHLTPDRARELALTLSQGKWTHDYPITLDEAKEMGIPVSDAMPVEIYELMDLYPQARQQRPGVEFIPIPYTPAPARPGQGTPKN